MPISILELSTNRDDSTKYHDAHITSLADIELAKSIDTKVFVTKYSHELFDAYVTCDVAVKADCDRCGEPFDQVVKLDFHSEFSDHPEDDQWPIINNTIDVDEPIRQEILFEMPTRLLCKLDCKGMIHIK